MHAVRMRNLRLLRAVLPMLGVWIVIAYSEARAAQPQETGYAVRKPVFGGSTPTAGWGAIGTIVREVMESQGWDVQLCRSCAGAARAARLVSAAVVPQAPPPDSDDPRPPNGPLDFGATSPQYLWWAYQGTHDFAEDSEGPRTNLRLIANIQTPSYLLVAVEADFGITDLGQIPERNLPVRFHIYFQSRDVAPVILDHYGFSVEDAGFFGGPFGSLEEDPASIDVMLGYGSPSGHYPEWRIVNETMDLRYLELPTDLRTRMSTQFDLEERSIPVGLFRGVDAPVPALVRTGTVIYGRDDMPDDFAYTLARALDEQQHLLQWVNVEYSYNPHTVWKAYGVPLHPAAERYYREVGYMK